MKIVHVASSSSTGGISMSGIESHILNLASVQTARGHDVMVVTDEPPEFFTSSCRQYGISLASEIGLSPVARERGLTVERTTRNLAARFGDFGAEIVHCHQSAEIHAIPAAFSIHVPCVYTHHTDIGLSKQRGEYAALLRDHFSVICVCRTAIESLKRAGMPESRIYFIPNGSRVAAESNEVRSKSRRPNLIFVGFLIQRKGIDIALLAMAELRHRLGDGCPVLNIYGDAKPDDIRYWRELVSVLRIADIVAFRGHDPGILERCDNADMLIAPSRSEAGPLVVLEAMSRGMPIVASGVGEVAAMLPDSRYGRIVPKNSILGLADAVESLLADIEGGRFDPALLVSRHRSQYSNEIMADRVQSVYQESRKNSLSIRGRE